MALNPWMKRRPKISKLAGNIVISYGEIEFHVALCLGAALAQNQKDRWSAQEVALRTMFRIFSESGRIGSADALMRPRYKAAGMEKEYAETVAATFHCITIRNQYAHCQWADAQRSGVFFTRLDEPAKKDETWHPIYKHIDLKLIQAQWSYFEYAANCLNHLYFELQFRRKWRNNRLFPMPPKLSQPKLHNPLSKHIPHWIEPDARQRHIEHARLSESGGQKREARPRVRRPSKAQRRADALKKRSVKPS